MHFIICCWRDLFFFLFLFLLILDFISLVAWVSSPACFDLLPRFGLTFLTGDSNGKVVGMATGWPVYIEVLTVQMIA